MLIAYYYILLHYVPALLQCGIIQHTHGRMIVINHHRHWSGFGHVLLKKSIFLIDHANK